MPGGRGQCQWVFSDPSPHSLQYLYTDTVVFMTHVYEISLEPLAQVLEEGMHAVIVLEQDEVLHPDSVSSLQGALHPRKCYTRKSPGSVSDSETLCRRSL